MPIQTVTKMDAATSQLDTAIYLWSVEADPVPVHTLAAASHGIIHDLNRANNGPPLLFDSPTIDKDLKKRAVAIMKSYENFCKHADLRKHQEISMEFDPEVTIGFMYACLYGLSYLDQPLTDIEWAFRSWITVNRPDFLNDYMKKLVADSVEIKTIETLRGLPKNEFIEKFVKARLRRKAKG